MKVCAITMVYRDYWALAQWYDHYAGLLSPQNLYIVAHGNDSWISALCPDAIVITVPREDLSGFDKVRGDFLNSMQDALGAMYDWVLRMDVDELICADPEHYPEFLDVFRAHSSTSCLFALGMDLVEAADDEELSPSAAVFDHRRHAVFSGHYSKAVAVRRGIHMVRHGVVHTKETSFTMPQGVYLVHLKYANVEALQLANTHRTKIAGGAEKGLPGANWRDADHRAARFLRRFETLEPMPWDKSVAMAYEAIAFDPETETDKGVMRAQSVRFNHRTVLPEWFAKLA